MANIIASVLLVSCLLLTTDARLKLKKYIWLGEIERCPGKQFNSSIFGSLRHAGNGTFYLNVDVKCDRIVRNLFVHITLSKCPTRVQSDHCEMMMTFPVGDQCNSEEAYFRNMYSHFEPKIECPLNKTTYIGRDIILDTERYLIFFQGVKEEEWLNVMVKMSPNEKLAPIEFCFAFSAILKKMRVSE